MTLLQQMKSTNVGFLYSLDLIILLGITDNILLTELLISVDWMQATTWAIYACVATLLDFFDIHRTQYLR